MGDAWSCISCFPCHPASFIGGRPGRSSASIGPVVTAYDIAQKDCKLWVWGVHNGVEITAPRNAHRSKGELKRTVVGETFFISLEADGTLRVRGFNSMGCLGLGRFHCSACLRSIRLPLPDCVADIQHGLNHVLALTHNGALYAWGCNEAGQLGLGDVRPRYKPTLVELLITSSIVQILVVRDMSYALTDTGEVYAWGNNADGRLGTEQQEQSLCCPELMRRLQGTYVTRLELRGSVIVAYIKHLEPGQIATKEADNSKHSLDFWCWGIWRGHQILVPFRPWLPVSLSGKLLQIVVSESYFVALLDDGSVLSWGIDRRGCLGLGDRKTSKSPTQIQMPEECTSPIVAIEQGESHFLALSQSGQLCVWGTNQSGQLGLSDKKPRLRPVLLDLGNFQNSRIKQILAFEGKSYALTEKGVIYAWGNNSDGSLGVAEEAGNWHDQSQPQMVTRLESSSISHIEMCGAPDAIVRPPVVTRRNRKES